MTLHRLYRSGASGSQLHVPKRLLDQYHFRNGDYLDLDWETILYEAEQHRKHLPHLYPRRAPRRTNNR